MIFHFHQCKLKRLPVLFHYVLKRPEEILLESEIGQLALLQKFHGQLPQRIHSENSNILIGITADLNPNRK